MDDDDLLRDFLTESSEHLDVVEATLRELPLPGSDHTPALAAALRALHTVTGTAGCLGLSHVGRLTSRAEGLLTARPEGHGPDATERRAVAALVAEVRALLAAEAQAPGADPDPPCGDRRSQPVGALFRRLARFVDVLAPLGGLEVRLSLSGAGTLLDPEQLRAVRDPLTHLVRNAVVHGVESPSERLAAGKPAHASLTLRARRAGDAVVVGVTDDGRGIDPSTVGRRALQCGLVAPHRASRLSRRDAVALILLPGFSTAGSPSAASGRGVGLDVVRTDVERAGGRVEITSRSGAGTAARLWLPAPRPLPRIATVPRRGGRPLAVAAGGRPRS